MMVRTQRRTTAGVVLSSQRQRWSARYPTQAGPRLITEPLLADLNIGRVDYAQLNLGLRSIGARRPSASAAFSIDSAASHSWLLPPPRHTVMVMSRAAHSPSGLAVTLTRALGQSALSVVSIAMVGQWFVRRIDMAMATLQRGTKRRLHIAFPVVGSLVSRAAGASPGSRLVP